MKNLNVNSGDQNNEATGSQNEVPQISVPVAELGLYPENEFLPGFF